VFVSVVRVFVVAGLVGTLVACAGSENTAPSVTISTAAIETQPKEKATRQNPSQSSPSTRLPKIITPSRHLECVPYARAQTRISLRGNAWTWWRGAKNRYNRSRTPEVGAVLVLKRRGRSLGHLAVVKRIVNSREIIADHANWLNRGRIHLATPIRDVSRKNDWSAVRVWYTPGKTLGRSTYPAYGFIHPKVRAATAKQAASGPSSGSGS
jgi:surface antigen